MGKLKHYFQKIIEYPGVKAICSFICAIVLMLFGDINNAVKVLFIFIIMDLITGISKAIKKRIELSENKTFYVFWKALRIIKSKVMRNGILKFIEYGIAIIIANLLSTQYGSLMFRSFVIYWLSFTELKSIIENLEELNVDMPRCITIIMDKIKKKMREVLDG